MAELTTRLEDIPNGGSIRCIADGRELALFRKGDTVYAIDATCPHRKGPLDQGELEDEFIVACPWHGWRFDIRSGNSPTHPGQVNCYAVTVKDGKVTVALG